MCHSSRRETRHFEAFPFLSGPDWLEQYKHFRRSARTIGVSSEDVSCATTITTRIGSRVDQPSA